MSEALLLKALRAVGVPSELILDALTLVAEEKAALGRSRTAKSRNNKDNRDVTRVTHVTSPAPNKEKSPRTPLKEINPTPELPIGSSTAPEPSDHFEEFWTAYPKREGDNPKKPARASFERAVRKGADPQRIIAGAKALSARHPTPTTFVPQAVTWLNQERWSDAEPTGPPPANVSQFSNAADFIADYLEKKRAAAGS